MYGECVIKYTNIYKLLLAFYSSYYSKFRLVTFFNNSEIWILA